MNQEDNKLYDKILKIKKDIHELADTQTALDNPTIYKIVDKVYWELNKANHLLFIKK